MIVVVVHAENVCDVAFPVCPPCTGVEPLRVGSSGQRRKRIHDVARAARPVQPKIDIVLRTPSTSAASNTAASDNNRTESGTTACPEVVDQPENHHIRTARRRSHVVKILAGSRRRHVRHGYELQERLCSRADQGWVDFIWHNFPLAVLELILLPGLWVVDLYWLAIIVCRPGKITAAFWHGRHGGKRIVRRTPARPVPPAKEKPFVSAIKNLGNL